MKRILFFTLAVLLSTLSASAFKVDGIAYSYNGSSLSDSRYCYVTTGSDPNLEHITIPSYVTYNGYTLPVTGINNDAFKNYTSIKSITIGNSVTSIVSSAFSGCTGVKSVTFNATNCESPSRSSEAWFQDCPLTSLVFGDDVKSIPGYIAYNRTKLKNVTIGNSVTSIGSGAFSGCTSLTSVTIPNSVTMIGLHAFSGCTGLTSVTIGNSVAVIGEGGFAGCTSLTSITIPNSVTEIDHETFILCI